MITNSKLAVVEVSSSFARLFSKVDLNKLWHDVQNEETLICAKFGIGSGVYRSCTSLT